MAPAPSLASTPANGVSDGTGLTAATRRRADQGYAVLQRLLPMAAGLVTLVRAYTVVVGAAAALIALSATWWVWPTSWLEVVELAILTALLASPFVMLWLFGSALREVVELPGRLGSVPDLARTHGTELVGLARDVQAGRGPGSGPRPGDAWRAGRLLLAAKRDLPGYGAALTLVSPTFLIATLAAALAGVWLIVLAVPVFVTAALAAVL